MSRYTREGEELRWYFTQSEDGLSVRSNFLGVVSRIMRGGAGGESAPVLSPDPFGMATAERSRKVRRRMEAMDELQAHALRLVFSEAPPEELSYLGIAAVLVPQTRAAVQAWRQSGTNRSLVDWVIRLPKRLGDAGVPALLAKVSAEAEGLLLAALEAYRDTARKGVAHAR